MSWRDRLSRPSSEAGGDSDKPTLEAVLDAFGVDFRHKSSQMVRCPLHTDNTPSFSVNLDKQLWNCKSCGEGGDSWELIKKMEDTDFAGAISFAAAQSLATRSSDGSGDDVRGGRHRGSRPVSARPRDRGGDGGYVPSWRRS